MLYYIIVGMSFSIWFAALAGLVRFKYTDSSYLPFIILCWTGAINEVISFLITRAGHSTNANNNIYLLAESLLLLWQFKKWVPGIWMKRFFLITAILFTMTWVYEHNHITSLMQIRYYFRFFYAVVIIFLSIHLMQRLVIEHAGGLGKDPRFLISAGLTIYFTFKILFDAIWLYQLRGSAAFQQAIYLLFASLNFLINLLYALAVLWMPKKPLYIRF
jgi:hypothetical protein